ncbi:NAD(P)/FAD-dependent oxidoreductase [Amycolatopsis sp. FDAARGOS 1241]|uniref:NAD(P)/FAD-dependent oxidoreductase n=1 Tax=Amycolatopsis sp. FDAARGOS 1241 TaxID=2778070 RepID=UPI0019525ECE|nr:FAD-dependent oxidoreductase [Amycolatopsis sp. FDAARGOS 1241]QRP44000.1 FAD-dependent oxidoreductase [Amycolatopsis sp. FDAARGOS 1241]
MPEQGFVIVGAGLAGAKAAEALRGGGFAGRVTLIGDEPDRPYERPPLSKEFLAGKAERDSVFVHDPGWYAEHDVDLRLGVTATELDRAGKLVRLDGGETVGYDKLLLATGSSPRRLPIPGSDAQGVHYLRRLADSVRLKETLTAGSRLAVIGAGWIGLEVAAAAREAGAEVTVLEVADLPLLNVLGREVATVFADLHRARGVDLRLGVTVDEITTEGGKATGVRLDDGTVVRADAVLVAVGAAPNVGLAQAAGLAVDNGVVVDASLRSSDPDVFAAGDVASALHPLFGEHLRVEHWANALNQPAVAAAVMAGQDATYDELPYFFTDQYDLGMEYHGHVIPGGYDRVVFRGDVEAREFIAFWLLGGRVLAGMNVNVWDVGEQLKALIRAEGPIDADRLADPDAPLEP